MIRKAFLSVAALALVLPALSLRAQVTPFQKQMSRVDLGISGAGIFHSSVSGTVNVTGAPNNGTSVTYTPSNTLGALVNVRYSPRPFVGAEFNYGYARYTQNFSYIGGVQANVNEYTLGYLATPSHPIFGFQPFVSAGAGSTSFKPTPSGGQGLKTQARATYYYSVGLQQEYLSSHFGLRASFRQLFYLAPDFGQNYLTIKQRTVTSEPTIGFYLRF